MRRIAPALGRQLVRMVALAAGLLEGVMVGYDVVRSSSLPRPEEVQHNNMAWWCMVRNLVL